MRLFVLALLVTVAPAFAGGLVRTRVYIQNPTSGTLNFLHKSGGDDWRKYFLRSGYTQNLVGFDPHYVSFNNGRNATTKYRLIPGSTNYFRWQNRKLDLIKR